MAWQLVAEVLDHCPADLSPTDRLVLVTVAEWADVGTRRCWRNQSALERRTGLTGGGLRAAYRRLVAADLDPRVPAGYTAEGRPLFAWRGHTSVFEVPKLTPPEGCDCPQCRHSSDVYPGRKDVTTAHKGVTPVTESRHPSDAQSVLPIKNHPARDADAAYRALLAACDGCSATGQTLEHPAGPELDPVAWHHPTERIAAHRAREDRRARGARR